MRNLTRGRGIKTVLEHYLSNREGRRWTAKIISGVEVGKGERDELKQEVIMLKERTGIEPVW